MRPKVDYKVKERLIRVARDVDDDLPEDRDIGFQEALKSVLEQVEQEDGEEAYQRLTDGVDLGGV